VGIERDILLNPGPVNVSERVRAALTRGDACHREPEVAASVAGVRRALLDLFAPADEFDAVLFTGSGTAAMEAAVCSTPAPGAGLLVIDNGVYGARLAAIAEAHSIATERITCAWDERPDLDRIDAALAADGAIDSIALVHHETTTGLINPVEAVGRLARKHGKRFILDTVSGLAGEALDLERAGVDVAVSTANKCIAGIPGIAFVLVRRTLLERLRSQPDRSVYLSIALNHAAQADACGAFTPAIQVLWALEEALRELAEEGVDARIARFAGASSLIRKAGDELGLTRLIAPELSSNTITAFELPTGRSYAWLHDACKKRGFVIYAGQGPLEGRIFRVATMGQVATADYERFTDVLRSLLS